MSARDMCIVLIALLFGATTAQAQGFAGLGQDAEGFSQPTRGTELVFPADHGNHPDFRIEWWYLTANLTGEDRKAYGVQWTLFRSALRPEDATGWDTPQLWMAHAAVTTETSHHFAERLSRGGIGQAGVTTEPFLAWIDDWSMQGSERDGIDTLRLTARGDDFSYDLTLTSSGPLVLHGDKGFSVKSDAGQASFYYSQPAYEVSGMIVLPGGPVKVSGSGWLDREWSSQPLSEDQRGWDWFSLSFDTGDRMMGFQLRGDDKSFTSSTWIPEGEEARTYGNGHLLVEPLRSERVADRMVPVQWRVTLADEELDIQTDALNPQSWMGTSFPYWEGPVRISGSHSGQGYLEMTGYE